MVRLAAIACLLAASAAGDLLSRLQYPSHDPAISEDIHNEEKQLDSFLGKELGSVSSEWNYIRLPETNTFDTSQGTLFLSEVVMKFGAAGMRCKSDLMRKVIQVELTVEDLQFEGLLQVRSGSKKADGSFKSRLRRADCRGTAAIAGEGVEWLLLDCPQRSALESEIQPDGLGGPDGELSQKIGIAVDSWLENALSSKSTESLRSALSRSGLKNGRLSHNAAYESMAETEQVDSNTLLDAAIALIKFVLERDYNGTFRLPDIREGIRINVPVLLLALDTGFIARQGTAKNLSTIKRLGDARITRVNDTIHFAGALAVDKLDVDYREFRAAVLGIGPVGRLYVQVEPVSVGLSLRIDFDQRRIHLDRFKIRRLGNTRVAISGLGRIGSRLVSDVTTNFIALLHTMVTRLVEERVATYTREALRKNTLDQIIAGEFQY